jgi:hypothetical protein
MEPWRQQEIDTAVAHPLTREEALAALRDLYNGGEYDPEGAHSQAERVLLRLIGDREIAEMFYTFDFWYA